MKVKIFAVTAAVIAVAVGIFALAAEYGTQGDPLVSLSYITDVFSPALIDDAKDISEKTISKIEAFESRIEKKAEEFTDRNSAQISNADISAIAAGITAPKNSSSAPFEKISLANGKTIVLSDGDEILMRSGNASAEGVLIDTTAGEEVSGSISKNHLYTAIGEVRIKALTAGDFLVRRTYN